MTAAIESRARRALMLSSAIAAALAAISLIGGATLRNAVAFHLAAGLPPEALVVSRPSLALGPLAVAGPALPEGLDIELESDPRVRMLVTEESLILPARVSGSLAGHAYASDVAVLGVSESSAAWLSPRLDEASFADALPTPMEGGSVAGVHGQASLGGTERPIPVVAPRLILDAYNNSFAEANGLPGLTEEALIGRQFFLEIGQSSLSRAEREPISIPVRLAAFTSRADIAGIIVPREFVRRMHQRFEVMGSARRIIILPTSPSDGEEIAAALKKRGFHVSGPVERLRSVRLVETGVGAAVAGAAVILGTLAALTAFFAATAHVLARRDEAELFHHLGMGRAEIIARFARHLTRCASIGGALGALLGSFLAAGGFFLLTRLAPGLLSASLPTGTFLAAILVGAALPIAATAVGATLGAALVIPRWEERR